MPHFALAARRGIAALFLFSGCAARVLAFDPAAGDLAKADPAHIRVLSYNCQQNFIVDPTRDDEFERLIEAINPDVILFQEMVGVTFTEIKTRLESYFPGQTWAVQIGLSSGGLRNAIATRYPMSMQIQDTTPASELRGVTAGLVNLPDATYGSTDLYIMGIHFKSGGTFDDHRRRQVHADAIVNWMRDIRSPGGNITLPAGTPMLVGGDTNTGFQDQGDQLPYHTRRTLRTGDILDEPTYGSDSPPDWDGTNAGEAAPYDHTSGDSHTHSSAFANPNSRLDRVFFTDSVMREANGFILNTRTMTPGALAAAGVLADDCEIAADHLPVIVDFALGADPAPPGRLVVNEFSYDDAGADDRSFFEIKNVGGRPVNLEAPIDYQVLVSGNNASASPPGAANEFQRYDLLGVIPPGGIYVLYSAAGESSGIAAGLASALPALQRFNLNGFTLPNGPDFSVALVEVDPIDLDAYDDLLVEGYHVEDSAAGGSHYLRTINDETFAFSGAQLSAVAVTASDTMTFSRNVGAETPNDFSAWTNPDLATPGLENNTSAATPTPTPTPSLTPTPTPAPSAARTWMRYD